MAKIIKKGKDVDWISEEKTCRSCGTLFQLEAKDVLSAESPANHYDMWGGYDCPGCGVHDDCFVPRHVGRYAEERKERKK